MKSGLVWYRGNYEDFVKTQSNKRTLVCLALIGQCFTKTLFPRAHISCQMCLFQIHGVEDVFFKTLSFRKQWIDIVIITPNFLYGYNDYNNRGGE